MLTKDRARVLASLGFILAFLTTAGMLAYAQVGVAFVVIDSKGKILGPVVGVWPGGDLYGQTTVELPYKGGKWLTVTVQRNGFTPGDLLSFTSSDCTGQAYLYPPDTSPFPLTETSAKDNYVYVESGPPEQVTLNSGIADNGQCYLSAYSGTAVPMNAAINLGIFTPPFSVVRKNW